MRYTIIGAAMLGGAAVTAVVSRLSGHFRRDIATLMVVVGVVGIAIMAEARRSHPRTEITEAIVGTILMIIAVVGAAGLMLADAMHPGWAFALGGVGLAGLACLLNATDGTQEDPAPTAPR